MARARNPSLPAGRRRGVALALLTALAGLGGLSALRPARAADDLEPEPPWTFFSAPDEEAARAADALLTNSYGDLNKVGPAREAHVRRFGVWCVPRLLQELGGPTNDAATFNAALTVIALRGRVGPAPELAPLLRPLIELTRSAEDWRRAAALLALGSFHGVDGLGRERQRVDRLVATDPVADARRLYLAEVQALLKGALRDANPQVRAAAALAIGKTGGAPGRWDLLEERQQQPLRKDASIEARIAVLLALGLLSEGADEFEQDRFIEALEDTERRVGAAGALALALQAVGDPPRWTDDPERALRALSRVVGSKADAAEAVFARGCLAALRQRIDVWEAVLAAAVEATSHDVASAAAQVLIACDPALHGRMLQLLTTQTKALDEPVLAALLLRAGWNALPEGVHACREWLGNPALSPRADKEWDPRWHAVLGLLRALAEGRASDPAGRREVLAALEAAVERGLDREAPLLPALQDLLRTHRALLATRPDARLPEDALHAVEAVVRCRYGLLAPDLRATAVERANAMIHDEVFLLADLRPLAAGKEKDKDGSAKRFLHRYLADWPYLSRLDVLVERGRRPPPALSFDDPAKVLDRR